MTDRHDTRTDPKTPLRSPCINVCQVSGRTGWCEGCFRTLKEIAGWRRMTEAERDAVMADLPRRRSAARRTTSSPESPPALS